jgi:hypothetical protein
MSESHPHLGPWTLLPAKKGTCPECAADHDPRMPHNQQSLYYQYSFIGKHGRWPTWCDAMAHCDQAMKNAWTIALREKGVKI